MIRNQSAFFSADASAKMVLSVIFVQSVDKSVSSV
jgi:hypothetical protein